MKLLILAALISSVAHADTLVSVSNQLQPPLDVDVVFFAKNNAHCSGSRCAVAWVVHDIPPLNTLAVQIPAAVEASARIANSVTTPLIPVSPAYLYSVDYDLGYSLNLDGYANSLNQIQFVNHVDEMAHLDLFKLGKLYSTAPSIRPGGYENFELPQEIWITLGKDEFPGDHTREGSLLDAQQIRSATRFSLQGFTQVNIAMVGGGTTPISFVLVSEQ